MPTHRHILTLLATESYPFENTLTVFSAMAHNNNEIMQLPGNPCIKYTIWFHLIKELLLCYRLKPFSLSLPFSLTSRIQVIKYLIQDLEASEG